MSGKVKNRRFGVWPRRTLVAVAVSLVCLAIFNWSWSSRVETNYRQISLFNNGETLLVNSFSLRPDFWNFLRSKRNNKYHNQSSWDKTWVFRRQGSVWEFDREISSAQPLAGYEDHPHVVFFWQLVSQEALSFNIVNIYDFSSLEDEASESLDRLVPVRPGPAGEGWEAWNLLKDIPQIEPQTVSYYHSPEAGLVVAFDFTAGIVYTLMPDGDGWRLASELSARSPTFGIDTEVETDPKIEHIGLGGSNLVVSIETAHQDGSGIVYFLHWDGSDWQPEQTIGYRSLAQSSGLGQNFSSSDFQAIHVDDDRVLLMDYGNDSYWVVFERNPQIRPVWFEARNSRDSDCAIPHIDGAWMVAGCGEEINIFKDDGNGWEFSQKLPDVGRLFWRPNFRAELRPMVGGRLLLVNEPKNQIHIFGLQGETWELEQSLIVK